MKKKQKEGFFESINIFEIVTDHFSSLYSFEKRNLMISEVLIFYILPMLFAFGVVCFIDDLSFVIKNYPIVLTFFGILTGFLVNLIFLLIGFDKTKFLNKDLAIDVLSQVVSSTSYLVVLTLSGTILIIVGIFLDTYLGQLSAGSILISYINSIQNVLVFITLFLSTHFILMIIQVIKTFYVLNNNQQ